MLRSFITLFSPEGDYQVSKVKTLIMIAFALNGICCSKPRNESHGTEVPFKSLTHASRKLLIEGWSPQQVELHFGGPKEKKKFGFMEPKYGVPKSLPESDEQWIYQEDMGHRLVFFHQGKVSLALEEWSDF